MSNDADKLASAGIETWWCNAQHEMYRSGDGGWIARYDAEKLLGEKELADSRLAEIAQMIDEEERRNGNNSGWRQMIGRERFDRIYQLAKGTEK